MSSLVVMGVSGCGKSRVGADIAERLGIPLIEGDDFHAESSRALMRSGIALADADRTTWLDRPAAQLQLHPAGAVLTCSALKASYRDRLRAGSPGLRFAWLDLARSRWHDELLASSQHRPRHARILGGDGYDGSPIAAAFGHGGGPLAERVSLALG